LKGAGLTILLGEQNVHLALAVSGYADVLAEGRSLTQRPPARLEAMPEIRRAYLTMSKDRCATALKGPRG